ncbi:MAG: RHS repeat-associated core domain-containing protein, partial [Candidatus Thiodiazotropha endolucinida]
LIQEEASSDNELAHTTETLDILQIEGHLFAQDVTTNGWDTMSLRRRGPTSSVLLSGNPTEQGVVYLHTDHLGAVVKATDSDQNLVWDAVRKPFGERTVTTAQIEMPLGFPGQYYDEETGNYYNYFRDYDPATGRYLQSDPIGLGGGLNTYAYVEGNPLTGTDPMGLLCGTGVCVGGSLIGTAILGWGGSQAWQDSGGPGAMHSDWHDSGAASGPAPHPHADEQSAMNTPPGSDCETLKWAIQVLEDQIAWRKRDLNPLHKGTRTYANHKKRIDNLGRKLDNLKREHDWRCNDRCDPLF